MSFTFKGLGLFDGYLTDFEVGRRYQNELIGALMSEDCTENGQKYKSLHGRGLPVPSCICTDCERLRACDRAVTKDSNEPTTGGYIPARYDEVYEEFVRDFNEAEKKVATLSVDSYCNCPGCQKIRADNAQAVLTAAQWEAAQKGYYPVLPHIDLYPWAGIAAKKLLNLQLDAQALACAPPPILMSRKDAARLYPGARLGRRNNYSLTRRLRALFTAFVRKTDGLIPVAEQKKRQIGPFNPVTGAFKDNALEFDRALHAAERRYHDAQIDKRMRAPGPFTQCRPIDDSATCNNRRTVGACRSWTKDCGLQVPWYRACRICDWIQAAAVRITDRLRGV